MIKLLSVAFLLVAHPALAQMPVTKNGQCPLGYYTQYGYCVPFSGTRQQAIDKVGSDCPVGWFTQGNYCARSRR